MKRIKYRKKGYKLYESLLFYSIKYDCFYKVRLDYDRMEYKIINANRKRTVKKGRCIHPVYLKRLARTELGKFLNE